MSMYIICNDINNIILKYLERKKKYVVYHNNLILTLLKEYKDTLLNSEKKSTVCISGRQLYVPLILVES
jgi:hypothetical protein